MINLLEPNEIKETKKESKLQSQKIITKLANEEATLNKEVNLVRENAKIQKEEIKKEVDEFVARETERRDVLKKEVDLLELRKAEALKPIYGLRVEAENAINEAKQAIVEVNKEKDRIEQLHEDNIDLAEKLQDKHNDLNERESKISHKENVIKAEEARLKDGNNQLTNKWVELHTATAKANADLEKRENKIKDSMKVLDIREEAQNKREIEQNNHDRLIKDKYATLGRAIEEAKTKYNI